MELRPYQKEAINLVKEKFQKKIKRVILCLPTGAGKTVVFSDICNQVQLKGNRVLILTHRKELKKQAEKTNNCDVMMIEKLNNQIKSGKLDINSYNLVIIDEAHIGNFKKVLPTYNNFLIGATATPISKLPLNLIYNDIVCNIDIPKLIDLRFLSKPKTYLKTAVDVSKLQIKAGDFSAQSLSENYDKPKVYEGLVNDYVQKFNGQKAIVFCCNIEHSKHVAEEFIRQGVNALHIDSNMPEAERDLNIKVFTELKNVVLCNCSIATTGFDVPDIEMVIVNRATMSLALWLQMCGRGSRVTETKSTFTILDYGENIIRHGHWEADRNWHKIFFKKESKKKEQAAPLKECPECKAIVPASTKVCEYCEHVFEAKSIIVPPAELQEIIYKKVQNNHVGKQYSELSLADLLEVKFVKGWKQSFVERILYTFNRNGLNEFWKQKGYNYGYTNRQLDKFASEKPIINYRVKL